MYTNRNPPIPNDVQQVEDLLHEVKQKGRGDIQYIFSQPRWSGGNRMQFEVAHRLAVVKQNPNEIDFVQEKLVDQPLEDSILYRLCPHLLHY